jgi:hypothetical protein
MQVIKLKQVDELINEAANNNRLFHYNGGQAYIQVSPTTLMVIDHVGPINMRVELFDGTEYFRACNGQQFAVSENMRKTGSNLEHMFDLV